MDNICNAIPVRCPDSSAPFLFLLDSPRCSVEPRILRQLVHNGISPFPVRSATPGPGPSEGVAVSIPSYPLPARHLPSSDLHLRTFACNSPIYPECLDNRKLAGGFLADTSSATRLAVLRRRPTGCRTGLQRREAQRRHVGGLSQTHWAGVRPIAACRPCLPTRFAGNCLTHAYGENARQTSLHGRAPVIIFTQRLWNQAVNVTNPLKQVVRGGRVAEPRPESRG